MAFGLEIELVKLSDRIQNADGWEEKAKRGQVWSESGLDGQSHSLHLLCDNVLCVSSMTASI